MRRILQIALLMLATLCAYANEAPPAFDINDLPQSRLDFGHQIIQFIAAPGGMAWVVYLSPVYSAIA